MTEQTVIWHCPSNLAIVKYWGKHGNQLPNNASISMTLKESKTITSLSWKRKNREEEPILDSFLFEGNENPAFKQKLEKFLTGLQAEVLSFLKHYTLSIKSRNTFPHSSGIASSASAMGALALCLCSMEKELFEPDMADDIFYRKASYISRLGSGSASRSVYKQWAVWGNHPDFLGSSDDFAIPVYQEVHPVFTTFRNDICIVSEQEKSVSSSAGHQLMVNNVYAPARYQQANARVHELHRALKSGDINTFIAISESEALTLHALMMCSEPSYTLLEPTSLKMISLVQNFRKKSGQPVCFSFDAGPNMHLLYPAEIKDIIKDFLDNEIYPLCVEQRVIKDGIGDGPYREK